VNSDQKIRLALKLLKPKAEDEPKYREEIEYALGQIESFMSVYSITRASQSQIDKAIKRLKGALLIKFIDPELRAGLNQEIERLETLSANPPPWARNSGGAEGSPQKVCALWAQYALKQLNVPTPVTKKRDWYRLSAIFYGKDINLANHMREAKKNWR
jgi:hypothetical protein